MENTSRRPSSGTDGRRWLLALLVGFIAAAIAPPLFRHFVPHDLPDTTGLLASMARSERAVDTLLSQPIWAATVGHQEADLADKARAVRLGAAIAEFELGRLRADSSVPVVATDVIRWLRTFPDSDGAVRAFESLTTRTDDSTIRSAATMAERAAGRRAVRLGAWLQSARLAVATGDSSLFDRSAITNVARTAITWDGRPETEYAVRQFEAIARERPLDWIALGTAVDELLRLLGTR